MKEQIKEKPSKNIIKEGLRRMTALVVILVMSFGSCLSAFAGSGVVDKAFEAVISDTSNTWSFIVDDGSGVDITGTCMEPANSTIPTAGVGVTITPITDPGSYLARVAYIASQEFGTAQQQYAASRAAAIVVGNLTRGEYGYAERDMVHSILDRALVIPSLPSNFVAYTINPSNGGQDILGWKYLPEGYVYVKKVVEKDNGYPITGAVYHAFSSPTLAGETNVGKMTIGSDGTSNTLSLAPGTYYIVETTAPNGWEKDTTVYTVTITSGVTTFVTSKEEPSDGYLTLKKSGSPDNGYSLAGAKYIVYSNSGLTTSVGTLTTKADGTTNTLTLPPGTYWVKETTAPKGWKLDTTAHKVTVKTLATTTATSTEKPADGYLTLKKSGTIDNGYSLAGAKYTVYSDSGLTTSVGTLTTKADGTTNTLTLAPGTYWIKETTVPKGWKIDTTTHKVTVKSLETTTATSTEKPEDGYLTLKKSGSESTSYSLAGAKYTVYSDSALTKSVGTLTTKADGTTNTLTLAPATYYIKETTAPKGWKIDTTTHKVTVKTLATTTATSTENPQKGYVSLKKVIASDGHLVAECPEQYTLAGAKYAVSTNKSGSNVVGYLTTKADGTTNKLTLVVGTYYVKEVTAPKGFILDSNIYEVTVTDGDTEVVTSKEKPTFDPMNIVLTKKDANGSGIALAGAEFTIKYYKELVTDVSGLTPARIWVLKTDKYGQIVLDDTYMVSGDALYKDDDGNPVALIGTYEIYESKAPWGYAISEEKFIRQVTQESNGAKITVYNEPTINEYPQTVSITVQKVDAETGKKVPQGHGTFKGAQYQVYKSRTLTSANLVGTITLNANGKGTLKDLEPGKYYVKESKAPAGYVKNTEVIEVDAQIKELNTANFDYPVTSKEKPITTKVKKVDPDGNFVVGATLQILNSSGTVVEEWVTTEKEHIVKGLAAGEYTLHEAKTPDGYVTSEDVKFTLVEKEEVQQVIMVDDTIKVDIEKIDKITKEFVADVKLQLLDSSGNLVKEWVTDDKPHRFDKLPKGTYTLREVETLPGYVLAGDLTFEVLETGEVQVFTLENDFTKLEVVKTDDATGDVVVGAQLSIIPLDDEGNPLLGETWETFVTTSEPHKTYYIPQGEYILRETSAPFDQGYVTAKDVYFTVENTSDLQTIEMKDDHSKIKIRKIDKDTKEPIPNTVLSLIPLDDEGKPKLGETFLTEMTDENGEINSIYVPTGKYILREVRPNYTLGYVTAEDMEIEVLDTPGIQEFVMEDDYTKIEITKTDLATGDVVVGAQLSIILLDDDGNLLLGETWDTFITTEEPYVTAYMPRGDYILREASAPFEQGYVTAEDVKFTVEDTGEIQKVNMQDDHTKIKLRKVDKDTKEPIPGTILSLIPFDDEGNLLEGEVFLTEMTDENGEIDAIYVPTGKYVLREVMPNYDFGYITAEDMIIEVLDTPDLQEYVMEDDYTKIKIKKVDMDTGEPIPDTVLSLIPLDVEGNPKLGETFLTNLTDENGEITADHVGLGKYIIRELTPNIEMGYVTAEDLVIEVVESADIQEFVMEDDHTKLELTKTDIASGEPVVGATLSIIPLDDEGNPMEEAYIQWTTTEEPFFIEYIPSGDYILREVLTPFDQGYITAEDVKFTVEDTGEIQKVNMDDDYTKVEILKIDKDTKEPLAGAKFKLYDKDNKLIDEWTSTKKSHKLMRLPVGTYTLVEEYAPEGYELMSPVTFEVLDTGEMQCFIVDNKTITKAPPTGNDNKIFESIAIILSREKENYNVNTGDPNFMGFWVWVLALSLLGLVFLYLIKKK